MLTAEQRSDGDWIIVDRDTRERIGSFGLAVEFATKKEALDEARRFGSKWDWDVVDSEEN